MYLRAYPNVRAFVHVCLSSETDILSLVFLIL